MVMGYEKGATMTPQPGPTMADITDPNKKIHKMLERCRNIDEQIAILEDRKRIIYGEILGVGITLSPKKGPLQPGQTRHHIFPKALGGTNIPENLVIIENTVYKNLCIAFCTRKKGKRVPKNQRNWWKGQLRKTYQIGVRGRTAVK